jgi:hypothetical protein
MMGLGLRAYPLLVLLALSQFAGPDRVEGRGDTGSVPPPPRSAPPEDRVDGGRRRATPRVRDGSGDTAPAPASAPREPSLALLLLLRDAAVRWHME